MMEKVIIFQKKRIQGARTQNGGMSGRNVEYKRFAHRRRERLNLSEWAEENLKAYMDSSACSEMEDKQDGEEENAESVSLLASCGTMDIIAAGVSSIAGLPAMRM